MNPFPDGLLDGDAEVVGSLGELVDKFIDLVVGFLVSLSKGGVDTGPVLELNTSLVDSFNLEKTILNMSLMALGSDDLWGVKFDSLDFGVHRVKLGIDHVITGEHLLGKASDSGEPIVGVKPGVNSNLVHQALVLPLLGVEASHPAELGDEVDKLVVGVLLDHEERLVHISDLDIVVLLVVLEESLVGLTNGVFGGLLNINRVDSVDSVVTVVGQHGSSNDFSLEELLDVDSLSSVSATFPGLVEEFLHLVVNGVVPEDSGGEVDEHTDLHSLVHVDGGLVAGPDVQGGLADLVLEILGLLVELGIGADLEELQI